MSCTSLGRLAAYSTAERSGPRFRFTAAGIGAPDSFCDEPEPAADVDVEEARTFFGSPDASTASWNGADPSSPSPGSETPAIPAGRSLTTSLPPTFA